MAIDTSGELWRGEGFEDLAEFIRECQPGGYAVERVREAVCAGCTGKSFHVLADDVEGCVQRVCVVCGDAFYIADSAEYEDDADLGECACPCGGEEFGVAVGFAFRGDGEVRWVSVGLRCLKDGGLGVYADWKIDYGPTAHLLEMA
ncbi:hypothetical protein GCM10023194_36280 [Planotetraspora phitsanulokensis]|uniref:Uncharacterized protein n=1 Tax=Planotetraspora phitsanulokensis TaxID=575192 RepID=A0A8J3XCP9_9ACTN|nr:hypothetical protein [Planotetraspora phitsanulokensis]GII36245.1 hypothetical protein Pph01_12480 [Planotetraspora phitsanulokensis]